MVYEEALQVYLQEFCRNSHDFPADVPLIVHFVIYSLQNLLIHLAYHLCDILLQLGELEKCAVPHS